MPATNTFSLMDLPKPASMDWPRRDSSSARTIALAISAIALNADNEEVMPKPASPSFAPWLCGGNTKQDTRTVLPLAPFGISKPSSILT